MDLPNHVLKQLVDVGLDRGRVAVALLSLLLFALTFVPVPMAM